jgi:hypothetical protein
MRAGTVGLCPAVHLSSELFADFETWKFLTAYGYLPDRLWFPTGLVSIFSYLEKSKASYLNMVALDKGSGHCLKDYVDDFLRFARRKI